MRMCILLLCACMYSSIVAQADNSGDLFRTQVRPILKQHCLRCHSGPEAKGDVDLSSAGNVIQGRGEGWIVVPGKPDESQLLDVVSGDSPLMPKGSDPIPERQVEVLRGWIAAGAPWPDGVVLRDDPLQWWSLRPLERPHIPQLSPEDQAWVRTPIDAFIAAKLREQGLAPSPEADRRTLIRRLAFNLTGLPPTLEEVERFVNDPNPQAYEQLVERLLASPHYGERWARHWLDVVHYGDTHGYDKDKLRPNAWPYRDYVIRAFNQDKPYKWFVREQIAGDHYLREQALSPASGSYVLHPRDATVALGFTAAGPFDWVGHIEVANSTMEKKRIRNIDRDDMVSATANTFVSLTAQCARCHDHKFDPITQEDYYSLQAVFAAIDRADRPYETDSDVARRRLALQRKRDELTARQTALKKSVKELGGPELAQIDQRLSELTRQTANKRRPEYGYHSAIEARPDAVKWVQVDLGRSTPVARIILVGAHDDFAGIGPGFGFPLRYKLEVSNDPRFQENVTVVLDRTAADFPNPGVAVQTVEVDGKGTRYVRLTATKLAERQNDYIFALAELSVLTADGVNAAAAASVTALDSIEAPPRWGRANLVDGIYSGADDAEVLTEIARLTERRNRLLKRVINEPIRREQAEVRQALQDAAAGLDALPPPQMVYAAATEFPKQGSFEPTLGVPRPIFVLARGDEQNPLHEVGPGTVACVPGLPARFDDAAEQDESARRAALAEWIVDRRNPLTWRSIVNRIWHYHFGRGLVETPSDFGRMGARPTHPELLDWLAVEFRDGRQSIKDLHRLILNSATYRQAALHREAHARLDAGNRFLWRMNRQRLDAETLRDSVLAVAGILRREMGGPGFKPFGFTDDHSPHYAYDDHDPDDPASHRRSIYRFIVRSVPDPFMTALDCPDPSLLADRRNETLTPLQALTLLNNRFMVRMAEHFASRVRAQHQDPERQVLCAFRLALQREPGQGERRALVRLCRQHGLENVCRLLFNSNEFIFVD